MSFDWVALLVRCRFESRSLAHDLARCIIEHLMAAALRDPASGHSPFRADCDVDDHIALPVITQRLGGIIIRRDERPNLTG